MSSDDRFSSMHSASTFKKSKKESFKVKVDDRFKALLTDERFQSVPGQVDQYGRKVKTKGNQDKVANEMKQFYEMEQGDDKEAESTKAKVQPKKDKTGTDRLEYLNKLARGEISDEDSSSDSDSSGSSSDSSDADSASSDEGSSDEERRDTKGKNRAQKSALSIPGQDEPEMVADVSSNRIAIQNCDWENLSAEDIMVVLQSFCPPGSTSTVRSVTVYVSDFGKKRMELEARYGPQGIWKVQEEEPDENDEDLYDHITGVDDEDEEMDEGSEDGSEQGSEEASQSGSDSASDRDGSDSEGSDSASEESEVAPPKPSSKSVATKSSKKAAKKGDFVRRNGAVGIVLHDDLKRRGVNSKYKSAESEEDEDSANDDSEQSDSEEERGADKGRGSKGQHGKAKKPKQDPKKIVKDGDGFDEVALRRYELSKLRYYFAVAECDCARTANMLYEELDGVEMESSAMVFDLSLVPEDLKFTDREVRDTYRPSASGAVNPNYKPPDFVVNALQHTKVQCSWDEGEKLRDRQLSTFSSWRNLNESELQQYVADSESSESEASDPSEGEEERKGSSGKAQKKAAQRKQQKAAMMRKMLLGDDAEGGDGSDAEQDDFFQNDDAADQSGEDDSDGGDGMYGSDDEVPEGFSDADEEGEGKTLTYMPELGKDLLAKKRGQAEETPYEIEQRKMAEKKKARKVAKKAYQESLEAEKKASLQSAKKHTAKGKSSAVVAPTDEQCKQQAELELLFEDNAGADDFDMRKVEQAERDKSKGKKNKRKKAKATEAAPVDDFKLDVSDDRFNKLFEGDSNFGIDKTSTDYRATAATQEILNEQAKRRERKEKQRESKPASQSAAAVAAKAEDSAQVNVDNLVNKLKRKFAKA